jgi:hypothetical protein
MGAAFQQAALLFLKIAVVKAGGAGGTRQVNMTAVNGKGRNFLDNSYSPPIYL